MTTWAQLLSEIRSDLKDTAATPKWTDAALYLYAKDAIRDYSQNFPLRVTRAELIASDGSFPLPPDFIDAVDVESPLDRFLERRMTRPGNRYANQGFPLSITSTGGGCT